jgi:hypothetical protein
MSNLEELAKTLADYLKPRNTGAHWVSGGGKRQPEAPAVDPWGWRGHDGDSEEVERAAEETKLSVIPGLAEQRRLRRADIFIVTYHPEGKQRHRYTLDRTVAADGLARNLQGSRTLLEQGVHLGRTIAFIDNGSPLAWQPRGPEVRRMIIRHGATWVEVDGPVEFETPPAYPVLVFN